IYDLPADELLDSYKNDGDVSKTIRDVIEKNKLSRVSKGDWSIQKVDRWLNKLTELTKDDEQITHLKFAAKRFVLRIIKAPDQYTSSTGEFSIIIHEVQYLLRLVIKDLRFNAGVKHILDGLHASAYEAFQSCRDLAEICWKGDISQYWCKKAEPCKSVEQAMKRDVCKWHVCGDQIRWRKSSGEERIIWRRAEWLIPPILSFLEAYFGTGSKGGMMSVFLMGVYDEDTKSYRTVTKCGNGHTDDVLEAINKKLKDQVGAEFSKSENHSAGGISIRFPRVTRIRKDKDWKSATSLAELKKLYECSKTKTDLDRSLEDETPLYAKEGMDHGDVEELIGEKVEDVAGKKPEDVDVSSGSTKRKHEKEQVSEAVEAKKPKTEENSEQCPPGKTPCKYGAECYRKNKDHKAEFWHPPKK
ncbi:ATP dependent DNA ligase region, partial [Ostertagia ostertagi]